MANSYYHLVGHLVVAVHACRESAELSSALQKNGFKKDQVEAGAKLAERAEHLIEEKVDKIGEDRIREHSMHAAAAEVEMWIQTVAFQVKRTVEEESVVELVLAKDLHAHDHSVTVVAKALRMMSMIRCDERVSERLGGTGGSRALLNRGHALLKKLLRSGEIRLAPEGDEGSMQIFGELEDVQQEMEAWLGSLAEAAAGTAEKTTRLVGRLGYVPDGVGIPAGGTSYAVVLHERGQTDAPDPRDKKDCSGWSVGRQGRNRENLGKGWLSSEA